MAFVSTKGTLLKAGTTTLVTVGQVSEVSLNIEGPITFDATTLNATDNFKEYKRSGHVEPGSCSFSMFWDSSDASHTQFTDALTASTLSDIDFQITFPDASTIDFTSVAVSWEVTAANEDGIKASCEAKLSGAVTFG
tara:strand:+ start:615 stop:1025 length:411 start_codon:yes stop_codon:yes gene_type:complete